MTDEMVADKDYHVLVVDDDPALLGGMSDLLEMAGYHVHRASNGQEGLNMLQTLPQRPDLIVSDIRMPYMDGYEFLNAVREHNDWVGIPFIFLTAKGEKEDIRDGKMRGVNDYLTKPFEFQDLLVSIQSSLKLKEIYAAAEESRIEILRRRILTVLNHEFRTPLSLIVAYADLMSNSPSFEHSAELRQYINGILDGSERLSRLVESFLILAEFESGHGEKLFHRRKELITDVEVILDMTVKSLAARADKRNIVVETYYDSPLPNIMGERNYFEIALRHLLDNAIKFSEHGEGAKVIVQATRSPEHLIIRVIDHGAGIPADEREALFGIFHQVDRDKNEQQGAGVGLTIVRHVIDLHDGHIEMESTPGSGSTFAMYVPVFPAPNVDDA